MITVAVAMPAAWSPPADCSDRIAVRAGAAAGVRRTSPRPVAAAGDPIPGAAGQSSPPWLALIALGSTITFGQPEWFVTLLLCGVVPIAC